MPTENELHSLHATATSNWKAAKDERNQIANLAKDFINATPEKQAEADEPMRYLLDRYNKLGEQENNYLNEMYRIEDQISQIWAANNKAQEQAQQQVKSQPKSTKGRTVTPPKPEPAVSTENVVYTYDGPVVQGEGITKTYVEQPPVSNVLPEGYTEESIAKYGIIGPQTEPTVDASGRIVSGSTNNVITDESGRILGYDSRGLGGRTLNDLINPFYQENSLSLQGPYAPTTEAYQNLQRTGSTSYEGMNLYNKYRNAYLKNGSRGVTDFFRSMGINPYNYTQGVKNIRNRLLQGGVPASKINAFISDWYESYTP